MNTERIDLANEEASTSHTTSGVAAEPTTNGATITNGASPSLRSSEDASVPIAVEETAETSTLTSEEREDLCRRGLSFQAAIAAGLRHVGASEMEAILGRKVTERTWAPGGLAIPYPSSDPPYTCIRHGAFRRHDFLVPTGPPVAVYIPPVPVVAETGFLVVVDNPLTALTLAVGGIHAVGLCGPGSTLTVDEDEGQQLNSSWGSVTVADREVVLLFRHQRKSRAHVRDVARLAVALEQAGARAVRIADLGLDAHYAPLGPDDVDPEALKRTLVDAITADPMRRLSALASGKDPGEAAAHLLSDFGFLAAVRVRGAATELLVAQTLKSYRVPKKSFEKVLREFDEGWNPAASERRSARSDASRGASPEGPDDDKRARIDLSFGLDEAHGDDLEPDVEKAILALRDDPNLFQQGDHLAHVTRATVEEAKADAILSATRKPLPGTPQIHRVHQATLRARLSHAAHFYAKKWSTSHPDGRWVSTLPPPEVVAAIFHRKEWKGIRPLVGVIETPILRPDGTILQTPGYDVPTRYLYAPAGTFPEVPETPSPTEARAALAKLLDVFADFPFKDEASRLVPIAAVLTLLARPAIEGSTPAFLFSAPNPRTGKTLLTDAINVLVTGREAPRRGYPQERVGKSHVVDEKELEKVLGTFALQGAPAIYFDNIVAPFGGAAIDRYLTATGNVSVRILGRSESPEAPWRTVVFGGGNALLCEGDTAPRVLLSEMRPVVEHPENRDASEFRHPDLLGWIRETRSDLVVHGLTILRAFKCAGPQPQRCRTWGGFEPWRKLIAEALVYAGAVDVGLARIEGGVDRDDNTQALATILVEFSKHCDCPVMRQGEKPRASKGSKSGLLVKEILDACYRSSDDPLDSSQRDIREALESLVTKTPRGAMPDATELGTALRKLDFKVVEVPVDGGRGDEMEGRRIFAEKDKNKKVWRRWVERLSGGAPSIAAPLSDPSGDREKVSM